MTFTDDLGYTLNFDKKPKRIISLVPSITETLYDLNVEEFIVGVTKFCVHPVHFKHTKAIVGGTKTIKLEKIKELQPDIVFCNKEENTPEIVAQLQEFTQVYVTKISTIEDSKRMIANFGVLLNRRTEADLLNRKIDLKLEAFKTFIADFEIKKVAYFIWYNPWMVAANSTYINTLLSLNKFDNIYSNLEQYPEINPKRIRHDGDPEVLFFSSEPFPFKDKHAFEISEYTNRSSAVFVDGEMFSWFGSRLIKAFDYFKTVRNRIDQGSSF
ncbi:ABC-type Fe3+-hydroxamate transport system substrate-binding protein [Wenyingzhuangia heitensis]|uniref:ABC-type Fe3+-hydroxamate transport system substrate-binding protein n=1 Tax=Wenyingzhuangia heitensis TaxID=1487859 RepID=A0ABX0UC17_9FLAO|nr:helical backbone metal receptor [Wenyingzhuangia heitensis]NIJ45858.1 ABC-type Fe3+-hydroxamate transport system substrate-binding protein [Wenyingzhuangia heitensis]